MSLQRGGLCLNGQTDQIGHKRPQGRYLFFLIYYICNAKQQHKDCGLIRFYNAQVHEETECFSVDIKVRNAA